MRIFAPVIVSAALLSCSARRTDSPASLTKSDENPAAQQEMDCVVTKLLDDNIFEEGLGPMNRADSDSENITFRNSPDLSTVKVGQFRFTNGTNGVTIARVSNATETTITLDGTPFGTLKIAYDNASQIASLSDNTHLIAQSDCSDRLIPYYFEWNMTQNQFENDTFNMSYEEISHRSDIRGIDISVTGNSTRGLKVSVANSGTAKCTVESQTVVRDTIVIRVDAKIQEDQGECNVTIVKSNGKKAVAKIRQISG